MFTDFVRWIKDHFAEQASSRELRVSEIKQLGDKRLIAVIEVGAERFLVGASGSSVSLLSTLAPRPFAKAVVAQSRRRSK